MELQRRKSGGFIPVFLFLLIIFTMCMLSGCNGEKTETETINEDGPGNGLYLVERVVDGDTAVIEIDGTSEKVRFIGVDTPESVHPDPSKNVEYGKIASEYTTRMLEGKYVGLELDVQERDKYGRILAYVYLDDEMFNYKLIQEGHGKVATYPPNVKYTEMFEEAQKNAQQEGKGLWGYEKGEADLQTQQLAAAVEAGSEEYYIGNSNTLKYHKPDCSSVQSMKEENKVRFNTKGEAETENYEACGRCKP